MVQTPCKSLVQTEGFQSKQGWQEIFACGLREVFLIQDRARNWEDDSNRNCDNFLAQAVFYSVSQTGTLETLIGRAGCIPITCLGTSEVRLLRTWSLMAKYEIMVLACHVGPFHLTLTQINSEMNRIAKNKCPESQKTRDAEVSTPYHTYQEQQHVYVCILSLIYFMCYRADFG